MLQHLKKAISQIEMGFFIKLQHLELHIFAIFWQKMWQFGAHYANRRTAEP